MCGGQPVSYHCRRKQKHEWQIGLHGSSSTTTVEPVLMLPQNSTAVPFVLPCFSGGGETDAVLVLDTAVEENRKEMADRAARFSDRLLYVLIAETENLYYCWLPRGTAKLRAGYSWCSIYAECCQCKHTGSIIIPAESNSRLNSIFKLLRYTCVLQNAIPNIGKPHK